jgi:hypothetical protein
MNTLFYLLVGASSTMGIHILVKYTYLDDMIAISLSCVWAFVLIMIYSDVIARRENQYLLLAQSFDFHRTLRPDNRIGAVVPVVTAPEPVIEETLEPVKKPEISKIEIVHTMDKDMDPAKEKKA